MVVTSAAGSEQASIQRAHLLPPEAQDLTQEAYARAWPRWKRLRAYENRESVVPPPDEDMLTLVAALKRLPLSQRKVLVLHYLLDMSVAEIAAETGTNVNTVKTWLARGRANAAAELSVYSTVTRRESRLGRHKIEGNCAGIPGKYACADEKGFVWFH